MTDKPGTLEERLRTTRLLSQRNQMALQIEAADEIASLRARVEAAESAARSSHDVVELMRQTIAKLDARLREKETKNER